MTSPTPSAPSASTASSASSASSGKQDSHSQATDVGFYRRYHLPGLFAEDYEKYCEGGYHPIDIGDKIAQRFTIVHKLGYGGFATVWLAREEGESRYVALKVVAADYSETYEELPAIATLLEQFPDLFLAELERFHVDSPNGRHLCQIFPVLGPTLHPLTDVFHRLYPEIALDWCRQLVHAVEVMHSHGLCHGDLTPHNIAVRLSKQLNSMSEDDIWALCPLKKEKPVLLPEYEADSTSCAPKYIVEPMDLALLPPEYLTSKLTILDFDQAYPIQDPPCYLTGIAPQYMAPESIFEFKNGPPADVWALGCIMFRMRCGMQLFTDLPEIPMNAAANMFGIFRGLPEPWMQVKFHRDGWPVVEGEEIHEDDDLSDFTGNYRDPTFGLLTLWEYVQQTLDPRRPEIVDRSVGTVELCGPMLQRGCLKEDWVAEHATPISKEEADCFYDLMSRVFEYDSGKRLTAAEMLRHPWFKGEYVPEEGIHAQESLQ